MSDLFSITKNINLLPHHKLSAAAASTSAAAFSRPPPPAHLDLPRHLSLHFSDVRFNTSLLHRVLDLSPAAGRAAVDLYCWIFAPSSLPTSPSPSSSTSSAAAATSRSSSTSSPNSTALRGSRPPRLRRLTSPGPPPLRFPPHDRRAFAALTEHRFSGHAEHTIKRYADEIFPDEEICTALIRGWSAAGKLDEARRLMGEMLRGGFELCTPAYNSILDCVRGFCRKKDSLRLQSKADKVLVEMRAAGIPRDAETFGVLISNLCKIRKTEDAMKLFRKMGNWGRSPNAETYLTLIRSLYQMEHRRSLQTKLDASLR
ncbi:pentatricopeptide repeat-containing protein PNM1, mitochondrial-like [Phoenix dactylifera]|uniref:Pentatricopeptide repeat-containing protein PNM1, mitochondrial-like n=1 Tax=Phoenix dactylifera TaxID=42345 RepID=A0A8B9AK72_PHODC|nr:pentatricopeptide repeat-containing protein PNM1, mitochondrial-like [Phoenix dactylifera]